MPALFILAVVFAIITLALGIGTLIVGSMSRKQKAIRQAREDARREQPESPSTWGRSYDNGRDRNLDPVRFWLRNAAFGCLAVVVLCTFFSSATIVSTKNVGIVTSFGRPVGSLSNGFHMVAPWDKVTEMDAAIQTDNHVQNEKDSSCISVRIAHQAVACVDTSIRWRIQDNQADELFQNYRDFTNVRDSLVTRELNAALNSVFESYDPLAINNAGVSTAPSLNSLSAKVTSQMQDEIGTQINVLSVIIPVIHFDDNTQGRINALQAQIAQTRIAKQAVITAQQQAKANRKLAQSVSKDPNVLVSKCFDLLNEMVAKTQQIPIGFSCWPGGGSSVVVPGVQSGK